MGRPRKEIKEEQLRVICKLMATQEECAAYFNCSPNTIALWVKTNFDQTFKEFKEESFVHTRFDIRQRALKRSHKSDDMLKFCAINMDNWSTKPSSETNDTPTDINITLNYGKDEPSSES